MKGGEMEILKKWNSLSLVVRILIGLLIGAALGLAVPGMTWIGVPGKLFVGALKAIAPLLVFVLVASSLANAKGGNMSKFRTVIFLYLFSTLCAAVVAVVVNFIHPVSITLTGLEAAEGYAAPGSMSEIVMNLLMSVFANPVQAVASANYIGILFWAVVFGIALKAARPGLREDMEDLAEGTSKVVRWVISCAPFGILGLVFEAVSTSGLEIFTTYGELVVILVLSMLIVALVVNPLIVGITLRHNPYPLIFKCIRQSGVTAFFTRSSAANIPVNMELCKELGLDEDMYSVSIPLGSTINMDGAAAVITTFALTAANSVGAAVTLPMALLLSVVSTFSACGTSGVAGGSLLLVPLACSLFGISNDVAMQIVGVGFIVSVIQDSLETALNSSGDVIFTATAEFLEWKKEGKELPL
ncbi:MAG: serine/threonine transporter SstT [Lachnospiraceae bacterium]|nr:serine/threonine transporter SstT [Lachnospiraceae bacterium]MBQ4303916.1 serine/threonine transporter SstT [Lachnospiraceae bacterium]